MRSNIEWDVLSIYPYREENIQEIICRLYSQIEQLKANGQIIDPNLIIKLNEMIENLQNKQISIDMFGAKGDGVKDDTTAIQSALEFCWLNNIYELYIPNGKFKVSRSITTKNVKLTGLSKPFAPNPIGFDYAYPTLPASGCPEKRKEWLDKCGGSIIESSANIQIFADGLIAENLMIFGDVHQIHQTGIGQDDGGPTKQIMLDNVSILCCGGNAIHAPYGLISPKIRNCRINSNMGHAIFIGNMKGTYTGETNNVVIEHNDLNRNGKESIYLDVKGRVYSICYNEMEHVGFVSHKIERKEAQPPTREDQVVYCVKMILSGGAGFGTGGITFNNNYSESTYGLLKLYPKSGEVFDVINDTTINNNLWLPNTKEGFSCGINLSGHVWRVSIWNNKIYNYSLPDHHSILVDSDVCNLSANSPITNADTNAKLTFTSEIGNDKPVNDLYSYGEYTIGKSARTTIANATYHQEQEPQGLANYTRIDYAELTLTNDTLGFNFEQDGHSNIAVGNLLKFKNKIIGVICNVSTSKHIIDVKGNKTEIVNKLKTGIGDLSIQRIGGIHLLDASGGQIKLVADGENVYSIKKY